MNCPQCNACFSSRVEYDEHLREAHGSEGTPVSLASLIETVLRDWASSQGVPLPERPAIPQHEYVLEAIAFGAARACAELDRLHAHICGQEKICQNMINRPTITRAADIEYWSGRLSMAQLLRREIEGAKICVGRATGAVASPASA